MADEGFGLDEFGETYFNQDVQDSNQPAPRKYDLFELQAILDAQDPYYWPEPVYGDRDYDYGYAEDGWPIPPPCPICGAYAGTCK